MLTLAEKILIFLMIYLDLLYQDEKKANAEFKKHLAEWRRLFTQVTENGYLELFETMLNGLQLQLYNNGDEFVLRFKSEQKLIADFYKELKKHHNLPPSQRQTDYDQVLRQAEFSLDQSGNIEIKIKRGQAE